MEQTLYKSVLSINKNTIKLESPLCRGPTARFLKNRELRRNSGSRDRNNYSKMSSDSVVTLYKNFTEFLLQCVFQ